MQNYHRHSCYSHAFISADSPVFNEDYAKRAVELGHKVLSSVEHGWQGYYFETYELAKKYNLKCIIGAEVYWVKDRQKEYSTGKFNKKNEEIYQLDHSNNHMIILAKNNNGRECLNDILSEANISGYYYKPRVDIDLIMSLPADDVFITTACIMFKGYDDVDDIIYKLHKHFKENFMLEIQYHNTPEQISWNEHLLELSNKWNIEMIVGLDSHYIYPEQEALRDYILAAKGVSYEEENGWYMDYPDDDTVIKRFLKQGVFSLEQIKKAMDNTDVILTFGDYDDVKIFNKDIKLPSLYPDKTKAEKDTLYSKLISKKFTEYMKNVPKDQYQRYFDGVKNEIQTYKDTGMVDYPLLDYAIVKDAVEHGCLITDTGRGSAVGFFTNTLCGFSKVDRFTSAIKLYPERFISTTRILETHSLPDIDLNTGTPELLEEAQERVLGKDHAVPMIAFGTLKKKSAFKLYAKAKDMDFKLANEISEQIGKYDEALKYADDESRDLIDIYDYVDEQYWEYLDQSKEYWGVISDKKKAPSAYLLYDGNIRREIGLIKCKSESTKKEYITCCIDGAIAENYKFLKNDILKVDVVLLIDKVFKRIGIEHFDVNTLITKVKDDKAVWELYSNGYTIGINQVEQDGSRHKCMSYKPKNISELSAFVAAIRPGFKSMYSRFEKRENFSWGINALDNLVKTKELPVPFLFYQEQVMSVLNYAGFPMDECYGIIKAIAKKHPEKVRPLKSRFIDGFRERIIKDEQLDDKTAQDYAEQVWVIINDNCGYGFNSAHAYSMALDSLYQAWQKVHYPYEFYEVNLQHFSDKGKKDKVALLKNEMRVAFGIAEGEYKFRTDNRKFSLDKEKHVINPALSSIKGLSNSVAESLYELKDNKYDSFFELLIDIKKSGISSSKVSTKLETLIKIGYFSEFGDVKELLSKAEMFYKIYGKTQFKKSQSEDLNIPEFLFEKYSEKITDKIYKNVDTLSLLKHLSRITQYPKTKLLDKINYEMDYLGYIQLTWPGMGEQYYYVQAIEKNWAKLYQLKTGTTLDIKFRKNNYNKNPFGERTVIKVLRIAPEPKWIKITKPDGSDGWDRDYNNMEDILQQWTLVK